MEKAWYALSCRRLKLSFDELQKLSLNVLSTGACHEAPQSAEGRVPWLFVE